MEVPVFALHTVLYPGTDLGLRVFEPRYLRMLEDALPDGELAVVAIRVGQEVAGPYDPYRVGVLVHVADVDRGADDTVALVVRATERIRLGSPLGDDPYPRWEAEPYPEEGAASPEQLARALVAAHRFSRAAELDPPETVADPILASYLLAGLVPTMLPERQAYLEVPGPGERLERVGHDLRMEAALLEALHGRRDEGGEVGEGEGPV